MTDLNATWNDSLRGPRMSETTGKVIFKYQMPVKEEFSIDLPKDAQIIRVADLDGMFWLWAIVDTDAPMEKRFFRAFKTGAKIPDDFDTSKYLGMCAVFIQMELGLYIFEDVKRYEDELAYNFIRDAAIKANAAKFGVPVVDIKLSEMDPSDMAGIPTFVVRPGAFDNMWRDMMAPLYDGTYLKAKRMMDIDQVLSDFDNVFGPLFEAKFRKPMNQSRIDEIEAQGGFDEEDN